MRKQVMRTIFLVVFFVFPPLDSFGDDLPEIRKRGALRHLGVPYANFVTGRGNGFSVDLMKHFAEHLGVTYEFVQTSWGEVIGDLTGKQFRTDGDDVEILGDSPVRGDVIATGLTVLPWRKKVIDYSSPTFPTQIWLLAVAESTLRPIKPSGDTNRDIDMVMAMLAGRTVLGIRDTCLDPALYGMEASGAKAVLFRGDINLLTPAVINGEAETCIYEVPDALNALKKWPGKLKVIGPLSGMQTMGCGFRKSSPELREAFNRFLERCKRNGVYLQLIEKYYDDVLLYFPDFFN